MKIKKKIIAWAPILLSLPFLMFVKVSTSQEKAGDLKLLDWQPKSQMIVKETKIVKPKYPVIDIHNHLRRLENAEHYLKEMDKAGVWICIGLDGHSKDEILE